MQISDPLLSPSGKLILRPQQEYHLFLEEGVYRYLHPHFKSTLDHFLKALSQFDQLPKDTSINPSEYPNLPYHAKNASWQKKERELAFILDTLQPGSEILEVGSHIGWLTNQLSGAGHSVTAIDYLLAAENGLKSRKFYPKANWTSINMDLEDLDHFHPCFDLVVFNHGLTYYPNAAELLQKAQNLLLPGGMLLVMGINVLSNPRDAQAHYRMHESAFKARYQLSLGVKPGGKNVLTNRDLKLYRSMGLQIVSLDALWKHLLKKYIFRKHHRSYFGFLLNS